MDHHKMFDFFKKFEELSCDCRVVTSGLLYIPLKDLETDKNYLCKNFEISQFGGYRCLTVEISEYGHWTILPQKLLRLIESESVFIHYLNSMPYTMQSNGIHNERVALKFTKWPLSQKNLSRYEDLPNIDVIKQEPNE